MRTWMLALLLATLTSAGCGMHHAGSNEEQSMSPERAAAVDQSVRTFMKTVAHDVTQDGPAAWRKYFADTPSFFMAVNGHMVFANSAAATAGIEDVARRIKQIELQWGDDVRVDPLTPELAAVGASYHESQVLAGGQRVEDTGYFTGIVEVRDGNRQFRDAHWSSAAPPPATP
jgi:hypothetical protein